MLLQHRIVQRGTASAIRGCCLPVSPVPTRPGGAPGLPPAGPQTPEGWQKRRSCRNWDLGQGMRAVAARGFGRAVSMRSKTPPELLLLRWLRSRVSPG